MPGQPMTSATRFSYCCVCLELCYVCLRDQWRRWTIQTTYISDDVHHCHPLTSRCRRCRLCLVTSTTSSTRHRRVDMSWSHRSHQRTDRHDDDIVPRRRVIDSTVNATPKTSTATSSLSRDDDDVRTISTSLQWCDNSVVIVSKSMLSWRHGYDVVASSL